MGEKAEDIFYLTDNNGKAVEDESLLKKLQERLIDAVEQRKAGR